MELQGHRGFGKLAPFNSIRGFHLAGLTGLESVEFDIRMIADKTIVVTHGPELENTKSTIEDLNWDEVQKIAIDENDLTSDTDGLLGTDFFRGENCEEFSGDTLKLAERLEQWVAEKISQENQKSGNTNESQLHRIQPSKFSEMLSSTQYIPLFEDVCKVCVSYNLIMNIELKESPFIDEILEKVMAVAKRYDPESKLTRISSFDIPILHTVIKKYPDIPVGCLYNSGIRKDDNGITLRNPTPETFLDKLRPGDSVNLCAETIKSEEASKAREKKVNCMAWFPGAPCINEDSAKFKELAELGVTVLCTNRPDIAIRDASFHPRGFGE